MLSDQDSAGMIPHAQNPYTWEDQCVRPWEPLEPTVLTVRDIDRMVAARLADAAQDARQAERRACIKAWEQGRDFGAVQARQRAEQGYHDRIDKVYAGHLGHILRRLRERHSAAKSTIAAERAFITGQADAIERAVHALREDPR